jgi:hypothetical protein
LFFGLATRLPARNLTVPDGLLSVNNFALGERRLSEWGVLHSDRWERDVRGLGGLLIDPDPLMV